MAKRKQAGKRAPQEEESDLDEELMSDDSDEELEFGSEDLDEMEVEDAEVEGADGAPVAVRKKKGSQRPEREPLYDVEGMHDKLEDIGWAESVPWEEVQVITHEDPEQVENVDDDMQRELAFYKQALSAAQQAIVRFDRAGTAWLRPRDYYAEMVKSDQHMAKVKEQLMFEQRSIEQAEERRKAREAKQFSKQVQAEKQKERNQAKKAQIEQVSKLRKQRDKAGYQGEVDYDAELASMDKGRRGQGQTGGKQSRDRGTGKQGKFGTPSKRRVARDSKFGFGGSKKLGKQNDSYSAAAVDGASKQGRFNGGGPKGPRGPAGKAGGGKGNVGGPRKQQMKRPGKQARSQHRGTGNGKGKK